MLRRIGRLFTGPVSEERSCTAHRRTDSTMVTKGKLTKEEELLLQDFSRNVSKKSSIIFYFNALIVSAIPICE